jgi:hypothetical protein
MLVEDSSDDPVRRSEVEKNKLRIGLPNSRPVAPVVLVAGASCQVHAKAERHFNNKPEGVSPCPNQAHPYPSGSSLTTALRAARLRVYNHRLLRARIWLSVRGMKSKVPYQRPFSPSSVDPHFPKSYTPEAKASQFAMQAFDNDEPIASAVLRDFVSAASFESATKITTSAWLEHAPFAFWFIDTLRPRCVVELGVFHGFSYLTMCQAASHLSPRPRCYGIDNWSGDEHAGFYGEDVFDALKTYHDPLYSDFSQLVRSTFDEAVSRFAKASIDLVHIDGRHFYDDVKHDFELWRPKLSDRAIVLFHDTCVRERGFGVWKFWEELKSRHPSFEFVHGYGLGVLGVGRRIPAALEQLFEASKDSRRADAIRAIYARLGALYPALHRYRKLSAELKPLGGDPKQSAR